MYASYLTQSVSKALYLTNSIIIALDMTPNVLGYNFMASDLTAGTTAGVRSDGSGFLASDLTVLDFSVNCRPSELTAGIPLASDLTVLDFWVNCRPSHMTAGKASNKTLSPAKLHPVPLVP